MKKLLTFSGVLAVVAGIILVFAAIWGICFTYNNIAKENITTTPDSAVPNKPVRGPFTLKAQAEVIRKHTLLMTGGKTYAEMPRQIVKLDESGKPVLDAEGNPVMVANTARDIWITVLALTTALNLAILTYVFSGLVLLFGFISIWTGIIFLALSRRGSFK